MEQKCEVVLQGEKTAFGRETSRNSNSALRAALGAAQASRSRPGPQDGNEAAVALTGP